MRPLVQPDDGLTLPWHKPRDSMHRMRRSHARVEAFTVEPIGRTAARLSCRPPAVPAPGQASLALLPGSGAALRRTLFPVQCNTDGFVTDQPPAPDWRLGAGIELLGPIGHGFCPPATAKRWLLATLDCPADRLLGLVDQGVARGAAVSLWSSQPPPALPPQVEVTTDLAEALAWADYLALDLLPESLPHLRRRLAILLTARRRPGTEVGSLDAWELPLPPTAQALIGHEMPCGIGVCGACAVKARRGWKLTCVDGPVFDLRELEW